MTRETHPLLAWRPPCTVIVFPFDRRIGRVRHIAENLSRKDGFLAEVYWKQVVTSQRKQLQKIGLSDDEVGAEINALFRAVQAELTRQSLENNGGAA